MIKHTSFACTLLALLGLSQASTAVDWGQVDDFQDGTTQNWITNALGQGGGPPPVNIPNGGPSGSGDAYMQLTSLGGTGAGSKMVVLNGMQWSGDYTAASVTMLTMNVNNLGQNDLHLRILFEDPFMGPPNNIACSTVPVIVPAGSGWMSALFPVAVGDLTALLGNTSTVLSNNTVLRIYHGVATGYPGQPIEAMLGVDNITAVPEPTTAALTGLGLTALIVRRRLRPRS
ncbi:MAG: PEP-CTERM sorting domain-containing protein [Fimbriimonadales bacterium]